MIAALVIGAGIAFYFNQPVAAGGCLGSLSTLSLKIIEKVS